VPLLVLTNNEIRVHDIQRCVSVIVSALGLPRGKSTTTFEVHFWPEKQQKGHAFDQPRSFLPVFVVKDRLIGAETSLALTEEVNVSSLG